MDELNKKKQYGNYPTPFEFLLINCYHSEPFAELTKRAFKFFIHKDINFFYEEKMLVIGKLEKVVVEVNTIQDLIALKEEEYFDFQNMIRKAIG